VFLGGANVTTIGRDLKVNAYLNELIERKPPATFRVSGRQTYLGDNALRHDRHCSSFRSLAGPR
jgi:hypothetical protein